MRCDNAYQAFTKKLKCVCSRSLSEFGKLIAVSIETLLIFCDDDEPDVRLVASDCINRITKVGLVLSRLNQSNVVLTIVVSICINYVKYE